MRCRVVTDLGSKWAEVQTRAKALMRDFPADGMPLKDFGEIALPDVMPGEWPALVAALARKRILWAGKMKGRAWVYGEKPKTLARGIVDGGDPRVGLMRAIAPFLIALADAFEAEEQGNGLGDAYECKQVAVSKVLQKLRLEVSKGFPIEETRALLHMLLPPKMQAAICEADPSLSQYSKAVSMRDDKLIQSTTSKPQELVYRCIEKSQGEGATKVRLHRALRGVMKAKDINAELLKLEGSGLIQGIAMVSGDGVYKVSHYFVSSIPLPSLDAWGRAAAP